MRVRLDLGGVLAGLLWRRCGCAVLLQDPVPFTEFYSRTLRDYKGLSWDTITPESAAPMLRVRSLQDSEFRDLVRRGYPFIVDDCAPPESELAGLSCAEYARRWPDERMRSEYPPGRAGAGEQNQIFMRDPEWHSVQKPCNRAAKHISRGRKPISGSYIWLVKDHAEDRQTKRSLMDLFPVPYFLNSSVLNANEARDSHEYWYVLENGGSKAHADGYCETTISLQLRGRKTWRLGFYPNITNAFQPYAFNDELLYRHDELWRPEHEEVVEPGQCLVFPMGYIHETYVGEGEAGEDGCSVSTTFQIQDPQPVLQWRNFLTRWGLSQYSRDEPCFGRMEPYVFLGARPKVAGGGDREAALRASCGKVFAALDANADGLLSKDELLPRFSAAGFTPPWTEVQSGELLRQAVAEKARWRAEDALMYHDTSGDGAVSLEEFVDSVLKFDAVKRRLRSIEGAGESPSKLLSAERRWIREHLCAQQADCPALEQLDRDYRARTRSRKEEL